MRRVIDSNKGKSENMQDFLVIGGGPTGSTAATYLARRGHRVTLFEKERFPREHVGESLLPFCYGILDEIGVLEEMKKRFVRKPGVQFISIDGKRHTTYCFAHVIKDPSYLSFHVIRADFDQLLLENSRRHGVQVMEERTVREVLLDQPDGTVQVQVANASGESEIHRARFLIDASGQSAFLARQMGWKSAFRQLDRLAISTHWTVPRLSEHLEEGLLQIVYLGGEKKGWVWIIPVGADRISAGVVLNHSYVREQKARFSRKGEQDWALALYRQELAHSSVVETVLKGARIRQPLMINGDYSYFSKEKYGENFALIGDASAFLDPIFASGVYLGMNSARLVSQALHEKLSGRNGKLAIRRAYDRIKGAYDLIERFIYYFYNPDALNLAEFGGAPSVRHLKHETAFSLVHHLLAGDFFNRHEEYLAFLERLEDPKQFARYRHLVLEKPNHRKGSCEMSFSQIFPDSLLQKQHE